MSKKALIINCQEQTHTWEDVSQSWLDAKNTRQSEKIQEFENSQTEKQNLKASAKAKLMAGEALTEEEANTIVI